VFLKCGVREDVFFHHRLGFNRGSFSVFPFPGSISVIYDTHASQAMHWWWQADAGQSDSLSTWLVTARQSRNDRPFALVQFFKLRRPLTSYRSGCEQIRSQSPVCSIALSCTMRTLAT
jgi:hypothetical protein